MAEKYTPEQQRLAEELGLKLPEITDEDIETEEEDVLPVQPAATAETFAAKDEEEIIQELHKSGSLKPPRLPSFRGLVQLPPIIVSDPNDPITIFIKKSPLPADNKSSSIYFSPEGKYHEVLNLVDGQPDKKPNRKYIAVLAVRAKIHGRIERLYMSIATANKK